MSAPPITAGEGFLTPSGLDWIRSTNASEGTAPQVRPGFVASTQSTGAVYLRALGATVPVINHVSSEKDLRWFLERRLRSIPEVERVRISERIKAGQRIVSVWTSLRKDDRETRFRVYDVEQELIDHFPEFLFEFHAHPARGDAPDGDRTLYQSKSRR